MDCGHFGSRFQHVWFLFDFPPFLFPTLFSGTQVKTSIRLQRWYIYIYTMKRTASQAFNEPQPTLLVETAIKLDLYVALNPVQFQALIDHKAILPDPYSQRFGLRSDPMHQGYWKSSLLHELAFMELLRLRYQEIYDLPNHLHSCRFPQFDRHRRAWTWRRLELQSPGLLPLQRSFVSFSTWSWNRRCWIRIVQILQWIHWTCMGGLKFPRIGTGEIQLEIQSQRYESREDTA